MAYQKKGRFHDLPGAARKGIYAAVIVLAAALILGVFYAAAPRTFLKLFLPKSAYAETVLYKNARQLMEDAEPYVQSVTGSHGFSFEGTNEISFNKVARVELSSDAAAQSIEEYLGSTTFDGAIQMKGGRFASRLNLKDADGTVMTLDSVNTEDALYLNMRELDLGWAAFSGEEVPTDKRFRTILRSSDEDLRGELASVLRKSYRTVRKDVLVKEDKDLRFGLATKTAAGDRSNFILSTDTAKAFVKDAFARARGNKAFFEAANKALEKDERFKSQASFDKFLRAQEKRILTNIDETGVTKVSLDLYVDARNRLTGFEALIKRDRGDLVARAILQDGKDAGTAYQVKSGKTTLFELDIDRKGSAEQGYKGKAALELKDYRTTVNYENVKFLPSGLVSGKFIFDPAVIPGLENFGETAIAVQLTPAEDGVLDLLLETGAETLGRTAIRALITPEEYAGISTPMTTEINKLSPKKLAKALENYLFLELPKTHKAYAEMFTETAGVYLVSYLATLLS
ncbi:MAG: hypothetical protein IIZ60_07835 [Clostridia bacterium]|nr:hypothetical protein [Clostridia bacterium]